MSIEKRNTYALIAVEAARSTTNVGPVVAWERAAKRLFTDKIPSQKKSCPKNTFLGLCEEGLVVGIPSGIYTMSKDNKSYALHAIELLKDGLEPANARSLWDAMLNGRNKTYNNQCDVVLALWDEGLIVRTEA